MSGAPPRAVLDSSVLVPVWSRLLLSDVLAYRVRRAAAAAAHLDAILGEAQEDGGYF